MTRATLLLLLGLSSICAFSQRLDLCASDADWELLDSYAYSDQEEEADRPPSIDQFQLLSKELFDLGVKDRTHWFYFSVFNTCAKDGMFLKLDNAILDKVQILIYDKSGILLEEMNHLEKDPKKFNEDYSGLLIPLDSEYGSNFQVFIKVRSGEHQYLPFILLSKEVQKKQSRDVHLIMGLYVGLMIGMALYNLFVYFSVRDKVYLTYVGFLITVCLTQLIFQGFAKSFLWNNNAFLSSNGLYIFGALSNIMTLGFIYQFLKIKEKLPRAKIVFLFFAIVAFSAIVLAISGMHHWSYNMLDFNAGVGAVVVLGIAIHLAIRKERAAVFFLIPWGVFLLSVIVFVIKDFGLLPYNNFTRFSLIIGSMIEAVLLSLALADRINVLKKENTEKEKEKLKVMEVNKNIVLKQNQMLELEVEEATSELKRNNKELTLAMDTLQKAHRQLVEAEKMASLGQLTSSIAHELNNPINFVSGNIAPLKQDVEEMFGIINELPIPKGEQMNDLEVLKTEIVDLLEGIMDGANRTTEIVKGLRIFSRSDENAVHEADVNTCIESALIILKSKIKQTCQLSEHFGELPELRCNSGKLTQVFTNIVNNAIQAIHSSGKSPEEGHLYVSSTLVDNQILVTIKDNGAGMDAAVRSQIFEPFFSTKEVGEGTGLGLSIVKGIIEDHSGTIKVESSPGEGSTFIISFPFIQ